MQTNAVRELYIPVQVVTVSFVVTVASVSWKGGTGNGSMIFHSHEHSPEDRVKMPRRLGNQKHKFASMSLLSNVSPKGLIIKSGWLPIRGLAGSRALAMSSVRGADPQSDSA